MNKAKICGVITDADFSHTAELDSLVDLYEVRVDLIGSGWKEVARRLRKPWVVSIRDASQGGKWHGDEKQRTDIFLQSVKLGAAMVDLELSTPGLDSSIDLLKPRVKCLISYHNFNLTPSYAELVNIVERQLSARADLCKVVTRARKIEDNLTLLKLLTAFPRSTMIAFAMGKLGILSRILCPLIGGSFTYASLEPGKESAPGQITAKALREIYTAINQ